MNFMKISWAGGKRETPGSRKLTTKNYRAVKQAFQTHILSMNRA
jgi:hypothetical protein